MRAIYYTLALCLFFIGCKKENAGQDQVDRVEYSQSESSSSVSFDSKSTISIDKDVIYRLKQEYKEVLPVFPFSNSNLSDYDRYPKDAIGIPMLEYDSKVDYYPITYVRIGLSYFQHYIETGDIKSKESFFTVVDFIEKNLVDKKDFSVLTTSILVNDYDLEEGWASAMAQGFGIGVMIQAYYLTNDEKYLSISQKMVRSFSYSIKEGGVRSDWEGVPFYEEYADENSHVLNGYIFSLSGLYYSYMVTGNKEAELLFNEGVNSLKARISRYDAGFTSNYSKLKANGIDKYASAIGEDPDHYHELVIYQLLALYNWTGEEVIKEYAHKFLKYDTGEVSDYYNQNKFKSIESSYSIDKESYGVDNLNNELWSWGNYWSTNKIGTELTVEFWDKVKHINGIVFYSTSTATLPTDYDIYVYNDEWVKVCSSDDIKSKEERYYKTDNYETFVSINHFPEDYVGSKFKIVFTGLGEDKLITLREMNIFFDRTKELEAILQNTNRYKIKVD